VVILFAVFFVMGYIVGRNSAPTTQLAASHDQNAAPGGRPQAASGTAPATQNPPAAAEEPAKKEEATGTAPAQPPPSTQPAQPADTKPVSPAPATPAAAAAVEPAPGEIYLQVTSVKPDVADTVVRGLKDKGFPAVLAPGVPGQTRVLVGPYTDRAKLGQAKAELERLGFSPFVKR
jgi:cell division septation protein DedD